MMNFLNKDKLASTLNGALQKAKTSITRQSSVSETVTSEEPSDQLNGIEESDAIVTSIPSAVVFCRLMM